jgi:hypothetical protein
VLEPAVDDPGVTEPVRPRYLYERRRPELGTLHQVVRENLATLYAAAEQGFTGTPLPDFVRSELDGYVDCGMLCRGFALLACEGCPQKKLVAFSCKGRGFCPSCLGRRMAETAANVVEHVLPPAAPLRQYVLSVPFELRARLAYDRELLGAVGRLFVDSVLGFYRRRMKDALGAAAAGQSGAVTVVQRTSADLKLNPHFHSVFLDGVFVPAAEPGAAPVFHALAELETQDVADLLQVIRVRVLAYLEKQGVIESRAELLLLDDGFAEREPALAQLAAASVSGLGPAGPERRNQRDAARPPLEPVCLRGEPGVAVAAPLSVAELGFSLHARTTARADDLRGKEQLIKYVLRPPVAQERLELLPDELVRVTLKRPFKDGTVAVDMDPLSLLCRLAAAVPPPRAHVVRYAGVLAAAAKLRPLVVPPLPAPAAGAGTDAAAAKDRPATHRSRYRPWAELLKRTFAIDVQACAACGGRLRLKAFVTRPASVERLLRSLGEPTDAPGLAPARDPPFYKSHVVRRRALDAQRRAQRELFAQ